ncbi:MAG: hypothetical protein I3273_04025 [Candidatus Moeniiplasma glomeromycotorum]|nr:hypothetical protein [Candidatus Moeniiplasma glomeromycotorum]
MSKILKKLLKDIETENIDGEEKILKEVYLDAGLPKNTYILAKHTYLKCNACGKKFSLNHDGKNFDEAKQEALNKKWEHQEAENHHQEEILYFGEEKVDSVS